MDIPGAGRHVRHLPELLTRKFARKIIANSSSRYYSRFQFRRGVARRRAARRDLFDCHVTQNAALGDFAPGDQHERTRALYLSYSRNFNSPKSRCLAYLLCSFALLAELNSPRADDAREVHRDFCRVAKNLPDVEY